MNRDSEPNPFFWDEMQLLGLVVTIIGLAANSTPVMLAGFVCAGVASVFMLTDGRLK